jgi:cyanate permease
MDARWAALAVLTTARASLGFQFQSIASAAGPLVRDLGLSYADLGFLVGLYFLPGVALALPGGALGRRFGDKRVAAAGLALMAAGGALAGLAGGHGTLAAGRLLSGVGAVLLNVLMAKMVTDWFAGREIVLAMAVFVNSFPIGVGLALLALGGLAEAAGWRAALYASAALAAASLLLVALAYRPHPNDGRAGGAAADPAAARISAREVGLVCLAGAIWGIWNGAYAIMLAFAPVFLAGSGMGPVHTGLLVGAVAWLSVASVQAGGLIAQRWGHPGGLMLLGAVAWGAGLLLLPWAEPAPVLVVIGLLSGLPVGVIMSLPAAALRPGSRGVGMGVFYTWLYVGHAGLPPVAGWLQDLSGRPAASLVFAGAAVLSALPLYAIFHLAKGTAMPPGTGRAA